MSNDSVLYLGVKAHIVAISRSDGRTLWKTKLRTGFATSGDGFVTLLVDGPRLYAHSYGVLFCLDAATGAVLWQNELSGLGYGIASLAFEGAASNPAVARHQERMRSATVIGTTAH